MTLVCTALPPSHSSFSMEHQAHAGSAIYGVDPTSFSFHTDDDVLDTLDQLRMGEFPITGPENDTDPRLAKFLQAEKQSQRLPRRANQGLLSRDEIPGPDDDNSGDYNPESKKHRPRNSGRKVPGCNLRDTPCNRCKDLGFTCSLNRRGDTIVCLACERSNESVKITLLTLVNTYPS